MFVNVVCSVCGVPISVARYKLAVLSFDLLYAVAILEMSCKSFRSWLKQLLPHRLVPGVRQNNQYDDCGRKVDDDIKWSM